MLSFARERPSALPFHEAVTVRSFWYCSIFFTVKWWDDDLVSLSHSTGSFFAKSDLPVFTVSIFPICAGESGMSVVTVPPSTNPVDSSFTSRPSKATEYDGSATKNFMVKFLSLFSCPNIFAQLALSVSLMPPLYGTAGVKTAVCSSCIAHEPSCSGESERASCGRQAGAFVNLMITGVRRPICKGLISSTKGLLEVSAV